MFQNFKANASISFILSSSIMGTEIVLTRLDLIYYIQYVNISVLTFLSPLRIDAR